MGGVLVDEMAIPPPSSCREPFPMDTPLTLACLLPPPSSLLLPRALPPVTAIPAPSHGRFFWARQLLLCQAVSFVCRFLCAEADM